MRVVAGALHTSLTPEVTRSHPSMCPCVTHTHTHTGVWLSSTEGSCGAIIYSTRQRSNNLKQSRNNNKRGAPGNTGGTIRTAADKTVYDEVANALGVMQD